MSNYKNTMAYRFYKQAEENLESGKAVEKLVERILKQVIDAVDFGETMARINIEPVYLQITSEAVDVLKGMGFKVMPINEKKMVLLWDFSREDAQEEEGG